MNRETGIQGKATISGSFLQNPIVNKLILQTDIIKAEKHELRILWIASIIYNNFRTLCITLIDGLVQEGRNSVFGHFHFYVLYQRMRNSAFVDDLVFKYYPISMEMRTFKKEAKMEISSKSFPQYQKCLCKKNVTQHEMELRLSCTEFLNRFEVSLLQ